MCVCVCVLVLWVYYINSRLPKYNTDTELYTTDKSVYILPFSVHSDTYAGNDPPLYFKYDTNNKQKRRFFYNFCTMRTSYFGWKTQIRSLSQNQ